MVPDADNPADSHDLGDALMGTTPEDAAVLALVMSSKFAASSGGVLDYDSDLTKRRLTTTKRSKPQVSTTVQTERTGAMASKTARFRSTPRA